MSSGTLYIYLEKRDTALTALAKDGLAKGVADGLKYLHSKDVIHGDLHPANVLIDGSGNPCLTDFGLATVVGEAELQWTTATVGLNFDCRWRAPEDLGVDCEPGRPTFKSDIYSFGGIMFFIVSGDIPWKEKKSYQVSIELSRRAAHARPENILDNHWNLIQQCWSWDREDRPDATTVLINECWSAYASTCPSALTAYLESEVYPPTDNAIPIRKVEASHRPTSLDGFDVEQTIAPDYNIRPTRSGPGQRTRRQHALVSSNTITLHPSSGVSTPPLLNVVIFGETRAGKSSIINLIMGENVADTSPDAPRFRLKHNPYELNLDGRHFRFWEVPSIASMGFLRKIRAKWQLKKSYKNLHKGDGVYLLLYCMRGPSAPSALPRDYKYFTGIVSSTSRVPIALVVNGLEGSLNTMDDWWTKNKRGLEHVGMHFSKHVCITSLPDHPSTLRSRQAVRSLICDRHNL